MAVIASEGPSPADRPAVSGARVPAAYDPRLDGLRGLAALDVVLHHASAEVRGEGVPGWLLAATSWLDQGHLSVAVFIVLSGFRLMLPVGRDGEIRGGLRGYFARRSRRILPAYYATLGLTLLLIAAAPAPRTPGLNPRWEVALPALVASSILPHLFLIQDLRGGWVSKIDPPM